MKVYVLHENDDWLPPFADALDAEGVAWEPWFLDGGVVDVSTPPPQGVFYSRMSASSHTRGHHRAKEHTRSLLSWLEAAGRRVVNGRRVLELEMSKVDQLTALSAAGFDVPRTPRRGRGRPADRAGAGLPDAVHHQAQPGRQGPGRRTL